MTSTTGHEAWFRDVRAVHVTAEHMPGLPLPHTGPDYASFYFTGIVHAEDTQAAIDKAVRVFADALAVRFSARHSQVGSTKRYHAEALLPSGLTLSLTAKAEHMEGYELPSLAPVERKVPVAA